MLTFDSRGLLIPDAAIVSSVKEFEEAFVSGIQSETRNNLYEAYTSYSAALKELTNQPQLLQWINGSYVTKSPNPSDLDLVTFLDTQIVQRHRKQLEDFIFPASVENFGVDAYIVEVHDMEAKKYSFYLADRLYWLHKFTKTKRNNRGIKYNKGFIELEF